MPDMQRLILHKASPLAAPIPDLKITATRVVPDYPGTEGAKQLRALYESEGRELAEALWSTLPGGTLDALIGHLLARRSSEFRVAFGSRHG